MTDSEFCSELKRFSDKICNHIFHMDLEWVDVQIEMSEMRDFCESHRPEKLELFEMIYENRFRRLWETWGYKDSDSWYWREEALD